MQAFAMETGGLLEGRYRLLDHIGIASSTVYLASREGDPRLLVARLWRAERELTEHPRGRALLEHALEQMGAARRLQQTIFARVEAFGLLEDGTLYVISEHVEGTPFDAWCDRVGIPPLPSVIDLGNRLCVALNSAHRNGLAHAALHPRNLIVLPHEAGGGGAVPRLQAKLVDFGVPSFMHKSPPSVASARFMAPEQLERALKHVVERTEPTVRMNVYSCGALLYYMCTGGPHLPGQTLEELMVAHAAHKLVPPSRINPQVLPALDEIILKALEPQPRARFASAAELANALISIRFDRSSSGVRPRIEDEELRGAAAHATLDPNGARGRNDFEASESETTQVLDASSFSDAGFGDERPTAEMPRIDTLRPKDQGRASAPPLESAPDATTLRPPPVPTTSAPSRPPLPPPFVSAPSARVAPPPPPPSVPPPPPPIAARPETPPLPQAARASSTASRRHGARVPPSVWIVLSAIFACAAIYVVTRDSEPPDTVPVTRLRESAPRMPAPPRATGGALAPEAVQTSVPAPAPAHAPAHAPEAQAPAPAPEVKEAAEPSSSKSRRASKREGPVVLLREPEAAELVVREPAEPEAAPKEAPAEQPPPSEPAPVAEAPAEARKPATTVLPLPAPAPAPRPAPAPAKIAPLPKSSAVRSYELSVKGSLASSQVKRGIERIEGAIRDCYKQALAARPSTIGELTVTVEIDERGRARDARAAGQAPAALRTCIAGAARRISVTPPDTGTVTATWKISL